MKRLLLDMSSEDKSKKSESVLLCVCVCLCVLIVPGCRSGCQKGFDGQRSSRGRVGQVGGKNRRRTPEIEDHPTKNPEKSEQKNCGILWTHVGHGWDTGGTTSPLSNLCVL